ncbi:TIGR02646 family protein [Brumimicrobium glaciale]|uniref:TIGR02646 family protein n=1 Tax=Brumimicrobium glaciale TaxID=200475 RepID=A0A4Q4KPM6_9FLAO|nr:retron system putative HNH endonuclease [Brumimicrobium glaciale]RYM34980.1 TIGR02646 family protein [Brumimicrobium glaciale]
MRQIINRAEPMSFVFWLKKNKNKEWSDFSGSFAYHELREYMITIQEKMCCYCEISLNTNKEAHLEHLKSRHNYPIERFNFDNIYASCQFNDSCGHFKGHANYNKMVLPDSVCDQRFTYTNNGLIIPSVSGDTAAINTIESLNLNCKRLKNARQDIIRIIEDINDTALVDEYLMNCVEWVNGFYTVIEYAKVEG